MIELQPPHNPLDTILERLDIHRERYLKAGAPLGITEHSPFIKGIEVAEILIEQVKQEEFLRSELNKLEKGDG